MRYLAQRLVLYIPMILLVTLIAFVLMRAIPGDPALMILAGITGEGSFTPEDLANLRRELGTDRPLHVQYGHWVLDLLRGELGTSMFYRTPIIEELGPRIPATLELALLAMLMSAILAVPLGALSAVKQRHALGLRGPHLYLYGNQYPHFCYRPGRGVFTGAVVQLVSAAGLCHPV
ncbi:MAG: ABC transporter permease [Candidatus Tectomicrobia bacterium]